METGKLEFMQAVLSEGFRMCKTLNHSNAFRPAHEDVQDPPVPSGLPRITPKGGVYMDGYYIPENVSVYSFVSNKSAASHLFADGRISVALGGVSIGEKLEGSSKLYARPLAWRFEI